MRRRFYELPPVPALPGQRTTPDHVAEVLREAILTGLLEDGEELNQVALAEHFDVSRVPIREALRQLQAEGLVSAVANKRAVVTTLAPERLRELFDIRMLLEADLVRRAVPVVDASCLADLESVLEIMRSTSDHREWLRLNREFHHRLYQAADAPLTLSMAEHVAARASRYLYMASGGAGIDRVDEADAEHAGILWAVRRRDTDRAVHLLTRHVDHTRERVLQLFGRKAEPDARAR